MLLELNVEDFALIDRLSLEFSEGLNIVTGETGAGKSILLDAVSLLLGARAEKEMIRSGKDTARIEGVFDIRDIIEAKELCLDAGYEVVDDLLILVREISLEGRSRCWVNGRTSTVTFFSDLGKKLVDLHGQHAHQSLLYPENHLRLLDSFGSSSIAKAKEKYLNLYDQWQTLKRRLNKVITEREQRKKRKELLEFQLDELFRAQLKKDEVQILEEEAERLRNADSLYKLSFSSAETLSKSQFDTDRFEILDPLRVIVENLKKLSHLDRLAGKFSEEAEDCLYRLEELARELQDYAESIEFNPQRLDEVEGRLYLLETLQRKYSCNSIEELMEFQNRGEVELEELQDDEEAEKSLGEEIQKLAVQLGAAGEDLSFLREEVFNKLKTGVKDELRSLMLKDAELECDMQRKEDEKGIPAFESTYLPHLGGLENIEFLFSANIGEKPKALSKIASGGEISRLMLAFKLVLAGTDKIPTLIFDEIDSGVGGKTGQAVAEKLAGIAQYHQVLCVTHLPQIAAMADKHFYIEKSQEEQRTVTRLTALDRQERELEISRMLSGDSSESSRLHAKEMLERATEFKTTLKK